MMNDSKPIIDSLIERERIRGATRMFPEGTEAVKVTDADAKTVAHDVECYLAAAKISRKDLAREIGYSPGVISETLAGGYKGDWRSVILDMDRWLEQRFKADAAPGGTQFVWTSVAEEIRTVATLISQMRKIGLVYGPDTSGIGKTMALRAIHQEIPGSLFITIEKIEASPTGLLRAIARTLRINDGQSNRALYAAIKEKMVGTSRLLIIDQIHNLRSMQVRGEKDKPLFILADLYDATGAPQLWCGTADMVSYLRKGENKEQSLAQIRRRITYVRDLMQRTRTQEHGGRGEPLFTIEQVREMFAKNKVRLASDAVRFLWRLACIPDSGGLGTCASLVLIATIVAEQLRRTAIDEKMLMAAQRDSAHTGTFERLSVEAGTEPVRIAKAG